MYGLHSRGKIVFIWKERERGRKNIWAEFMMVHDMPFLREIIFDKSSRFSCVYKHTFWIYIFFAWDACALIFHAKNSPSNIFSTFFLHKDEKCAFSHIFCLAPKNLPPPPPIDLSTNKMNQDHFFGTITFSFCM